MSLQNSRMARTANPHQSSSVNAQNPTTDDGRERGLTKEPVDPYEMGLDQGCATSGEVTVWRGWQQPKKWMYRGSVKHYGIVPSSDCITAHHQSQAWADHLQRPTPTVTVKRLRKFPRKGLKSKEARYDSETSC